MDRIGAVGGQCGVGVGSGSKNVFRYKIEMRRPLDTAAESVTLASEVLDAPVLQYDFYLNLVDWSSSNVLVVGLGNCVALPQLETLTSQTYIIISPDGPMIVAGAGHETLWFCNVVPSPNSENTNSDSGLSILWVNHNAVTARLIGTVCHLLLSPWFIPRP